VLTKAISDVLGD